MSRRQQVLIETHATRQQAEDFLRTLEETRRQIEAQLAGEKRQDVVKVVTGRSSIDAAIADTKRMIEALDRALDEARNGLRDEELDDIPVEVAALEPESQPDVQVVAGRIGAVPTVRWVAGR